MPDVHVTQSALAVFLIVGLIGAAALLSVVVSLTGARRRPARRAQGVGHATPTEQLVGHKES